MPPPLLILVVLEFSNEDKSINLKSLPGPVKSNKVQRPAIRSEIAAHIMFPNFQLAHRPNPSPTIITVRFKLTLFTILILALALPGKSNRLWPSIWSQSSVIPYFFSFTHHPFHVGPQIVFIEGFQLTFVTIQVPVKFLRGSYQRQPVMFRSF